MPTLRFQIFGFPVAIEPSYWLMTVLLGLSFAGRSLGLTFIAVGVIFASILVHELGHALAARAFGLSPHIRLHIMGGTTAFAPGVELSRGRDVIVSLAGPFSGFLVGALAYLLYQVYAPPNLGEENVTPSLFVIGLAWLHTVNLYWGLINLIPVAPLDGGRVLAALLGPSRKQLFATLSLVVGLSAAFFFLRTGNALAAMFFALFAVSGFFRARQELTMTTSSSAPSAGSSEAEATGMAQALSAAEKALAAGAHTEAAALAKGLISAARSPADVTRALNTLLWSLLGMGDSEAAYLALQRFPPNTADAYAAGATLEAAGELDGARQVLDQARGHGDRRLPLLGLLIQVMLKLKDYAGAAALTVDIVHRIAPDDARRVATEVEGAGDHAAAAKLHLAVAKAERSFRDACAAVFAFAQADSKDGLLAAYKLAKSFDGEASRRLLNDERLGEVRSILEST